MNDLIIGNTQINPGKRQTVDLPIGRLPSQAMLSMPVSVIRGKQDGPRLWISAAIHGDEINGVEIIHRILEFIRNREIKGTLIAVPIVNIFGFSQQSRYLPDRRDLNRCFPGSRGGSLAARLASIFIREIVDNSTHGIDIHTGAIHRCNLLQIRCNPACQASLALASAFQPAIVVTKRPIKGTLRWSATKKNKPNILIEAGEALRFSEGLIENSTQGILRTMAHLGMLDDLTSYPTDTTRFSSKTHWVRAKLGGLFQTQVELGQSVEKGALLGKITDVLGKLNVKIKAQNSGVIIGLTKNPLVYQGDALVHVAIIDDKSNTLP